MSFSHQLNDEEGSQEAEVEERPNAVGEGVSTGE